MEPAVDRPAEHDAAMPDVTKQIAKFISTLSYEQIPADAIFVAKQMLLDWIGVTIAGADEPLTKILAANARDEGGAAQAALIGMPGKVSARQAALVNGSAGHALDYDDVLRPVNGHPTAPVAPAVLALAEKRGADGKALLTAFVAGVEAESRVGLFMGDSHYLMGWHATGTNGTFGAAAGCASLLGLDPGQTATAFGIAGTQAAGLKAMFGTMCKPLHAGKAAENGYLAATLAARGFDSRQDVLECRQGSGDTQSEKIFPHAALEGLGTLFHIPQTRFKYHAACYGTHGPMEAARLVRDNPAFNKDMVDRVEIHVEPRNMNVCNIPSPSTGLEVKFSLRHTVAMALVGAPTGDLHLYNEDTAADPVFVGLRDKALVISEDGYARNEAEVVAHMKDGTTIRGRADLTEAPKDLENTWQRLQEKFMTIAAPVVGDANAAAIRDIVDQLDKTESLTDLTAAFAPVRQ